MTAIDQRYMHLRRKGWSAQEAFEFLRMDKALTMLEDSELVRLHWEVDQDYDPQTDEDGELLQSGDWNAWVCFAQIKNVGSHDNEWITVDVLGGVLLDASRESDVFKRQIEMDAVMNAEVGILAVLQIIARYQPYKFCTN